MPSTDSFPSTDQASGLRRLFEKHAAAPIIAVASTQRGGARLSDRAGVMMQLAGDLLAAGRRLTLLDEHPGPGGIAHAYGVASHKDLKHALHGDYPLDEVAFSPVPGLTLIPAPRAAAMEFTLGDEASLAGNLVLLRSRSNCIMIDCMQRTERVLSPIAARADRLLVVVPASGEDLTRAYGLIKRAFLEQASLPVSVIVVHAVDARQARAVYDKLRRVAFDHLGVSLHYQGAALTPGAKPLSLMKTPSIAPSRREGSDDLGAMSSLWEMADSMV